MIKSSKAEYKKVAFEIGKQAEGHASSIVPYRLNCVFVVSSLKQGNGFVGYSFVAQYPQTSPVKCLKAVEANGTS